MKKSRFLSNIICLSSIIEVSILCYAFYWHYFCMDHAEHLHSAWLVWNGKVPYLDFFQHHNPLMWYILAPIVGLFYNDAIILYVSRIITFAAFSGLFFVLYKIFTRFMNLSVISLVLSLFIYFSISTSYFLVFEMQPDVFMLLSYFIGFYYYCEYIETKKQKSLNIAFLFFTMSFLILQKILIILFFTGVFSLYLLIKKRINLSSLLKASILPLVILSSFALYLYHHNILKIYIDFNYKLNFIMQKFHGDGNFCSSFFATKYLPFLSIFMIKYFMKNGNVYKNMIAFIVIGDYISKYITGAPYCQYFILSNIICSIIIGNYLVNNISKLKTKIILCVMVILGGVTFFLAPLNNQFRIYYNLNKLIYSNHSKEDYLISTIQYINIYGKDVSYYWYGVGNISPVAYYIYNYNEPFTLNRAIKMYKPKFIFGDIYTNQILIDSIRNGVKVENFIENLSKIYDELPVKRESRLNFIKRWSLNEFLTYDTYFISENYTPHPIYPVLIRNDLSEKLI